MTADREPLVAPGQGRSQHQAETSQTVAIILTVVAIGSVAWLAAALSPELVRRILS